MNHNFKLGLILLLLILLGTPPAFGLKCIEWLGDNFIFGVMVHQRTEALQNKTNFILKIPKDFNRSKCITIISENKNATITTLYLDGISQDREYKVGDTANFTVTVNRSGKTVYLDTNISGWTVVNETTPLMSYKTFNETGTYWIEGYFPGDENYSASADIHYVTVEETQPLNWSNKKASPPSPATYSSNASYQFNITWSGPVDTVLIEQNFTTQSSVLENKTMLNKSSEYYFDVSDLPAGTYFWRSYANDTEGNWVSTDEWIYTVSKAPTNTTLYLNGTSQDRKYTVGNTANFTVTVNRPGETVYLDTNISGWTEESGTTPLESTTTLNETGVYKITGYFPGSENYSSSSSSHFAIVEDPIKVDASTDSIDYVQGDTINITSTVENKGDSDITGNLSLRIFNSTHTLWTSERTNELISAGNLSTYENEVGTNDNWVGRYNLSANFSWGGKFSYHREDFLVTLKPVRHNLTVKFKRGSGTAVIPLEGGTVEKDISTEQGAWTSLNHNYVCSENGRMSSIVAAGPLHSISLEAGQGFKTKSAFGTNLYIPFSKADCGNVQDRIDWIESRSFMDKINPSFSYPIEDQYTVGIGLDYESIEIVGDSREGSGKYEMIVRNNGTTTQGKTEVWIRLRPG